MRGGERNNGSSRDGEYGWMARGQQGESILIVVEEPAGRQFIQREDPRDKRSIKERLEGESYSVRFAAGAAECLKDLGWIGKSSKAEPHNLPDLLIIDWKMAPYDGTELLH